MFETTPPFECTTCMSAYIDGYGDKFDGGYCSLSCAQAAYEYRNTKRGEVGWSLLTPA